MEKRHFTAAKKMVDAMDCALHILAYLKTL